MDSADLKAELTCSICLSIYNDPVSLRCGHNFCRVCIGNVLDSQESSGVYTCTKCRVDYQDRPALNRNVTLCNIAERYLSTQPEKEISGVCCTYCIHSSVPAVKCCLMCEAYLCSNHLEVHCKSTEHVLSEPTVSLQNRKCSAHGEILKYYCSDDSACICVTCFIAGEHKGHQVELLHEASLEMKKSLKSELVQLNEKRKKTEKILQILQERRTKIPGHAADLKEKFLQLFRKLKEQQMDLEEKTLSEIASLEEKVSLSVLHLIHQMEEKKEAISTEICNVEELCEMTDPLCFLREFDTGDSPPEESPAEDCDMDNGKIHSAGNLDVSLISETLHRQLSNLLSVLNTDLCIHEVTDMFLVANTASNNVLLSDDLKSASRTNEKQNCFQNPQRFTDCAQVLGNVEFWSGRKYWEVETSNSEHWIIGMCYPSMNRNGYKSGIGNDNKSWGLRRLHNRYYVKHDNKEISLTARYSAHRFRVYIDFEAGRLSFYELCDPINHLYTFTAKFTECLRAVFCVVNQSWVRIRS